MHLKQAKIKVSAYNSVSLYFNKGNQTFVYGMKYFTLPNYFETINIRTAL